MTTIVADTLRLGHGFQADERDLVVELLGRLDERLQSFDTNHVELEITVKERETASQHMTLLAKLGGLPRMVATSASSGAFSMRTPSRVRRAAAIRGRTAFFAPATATRPSSRAPPSITNRSTVFLPAGGLEALRTRDVDR